MVGRAVQEILDEPVRADPGGPCDAGRALIQVNAGPDEVDRDGAPEVRDRVVGAVNVDAPGERQPPVAEFLEEGEQPAVAGQPRRGVGLAEHRRCGPEGGPGAKQAVPGAVDDLVQPLAAPEVVGVRGEPAQRLLLVRDPPQEVRGQDRPLGPHGRERVAASGLHQVVLRRLLRQWEVEEEAEDIRRELRLDGYPGVRAGHSRC